MRNSIHLLSVGYFVRRSLVSFLTLLFFIPAITLASSDDEEKYEAKQIPFDQIHNQYIFGSPKISTPDWKMSSGGRIYDNWWKALAKKAPEKTHPAWPSSNTKYSGSETWRCKNCHGWDYKGKAGKYGSGSHKTNINGVISHTGSSPEKIAAILRDSNHQYTNDMIPDEAAKRVGLFIARGLHDTDSYINRGTGNSNGSARNGAAIFQNVCATCHGFQGTVLNWGTTEEPAYVGTEANANAWEVLHKIRNGHPGAPMISIRPFGMKAAVDVLTYTRTLPE